MYSRHPLQLLQLCNNTQPYRHLFKHINGKGWASSSSFTSILGSNNNFSITNTTQSHHVTVGGTVYNRWFSQSTIKRSNHINNNYNDDNYDDGDVVGDDEDGYYQFSISIDDSNNNNNNIYPIQQQQQVNQFNNNNNNTYYNNNNNINYTNYNNNNYSNNNNSDVNRQNNNNNNNNNYSPIGIDPSLIPKTIKVKRSTKTNLKSTTTTPTPIINNINQQTFFNNDVNMYKFEQQQQQNNKNSILQSIFNTNTTSTFNTPSSSTTNNNNINNNNNNVNNEITTTPIIEEGEVEAEDEETSKKRSRKQKKDLDFDLNQTLTSEQEAVVKVIVEGGKNVFFTGSAGTGKSFVLKHIVSKLRDKYGTNSVYVTAASGIAAVNIGGVTLHSFAGIGYGQGTAAQLAINILGRKKYTKRWNDCKVLIIDEISMIDSELFEKLDQCARLVRGNELPFGGIQLVLCGDFFQLPPVYGNYAFECEAWKRCINLNLELKTVMRQKDENFISILNQIRKGQVNETAIQLLKQCNRELDTSNGVLPTKLYTTNAHVDDENNVALEALEGEACTFTSIDSGNEELKESLERDCPAPNKLSLKIGAQVVLLRKPDGNSKLVNGSRGVVVDFVKVKPKKNMTAWYQTNDSLPVVLFNDGSRVRIRPSEWGIWSEKKATRVQLPLKLAWALTIHRAQGMTLDKVECKLAQAFAHGQAYVALSRAKTLEGLYLKEFAKSSIRSSSKVVTFEKQFINPKKNKKTTFVIKY